MGPHPNLQRVQRRRPRLLRHLFRALPRHGVEAAQIRYSVSRLKNSYFPFQLPLSSYTGTLWGASETTCARPQPRPRQRAASRPFSHASLPSPTTHHGRVCVAHSSATHSASQSGSSDLPQLLMNPLQFMHRRHRRLTSSPGL